jgi:hypothetical protein
MSDWETEKINSGGNQSQDDLDLLLSEEEEKNAILKGKWRENEL